MTTTIEPGQRVRITVEGAWASTCTADIEAAIRANDLAILSGDTVTVERLHDEPGDPTGSVVYVTGDTDAWGHNLLPGDAVTILDDDYMCDGSYYVETLDKTRSDYVGVSDLALDPPVVPFPTGAVVRNKHFEGAVYTVLPDRGWYAHASGERGRPFTFDPEHYDRIDNAPA